jgi:hypothetical protein
VVVGCYQPAAPPGTSQRAPSSAAPSQRNECDAALDELDKYLDEKFAVEVKKDPRGPGADEAELAFVKFQGTRMPKLTLAFTAREQWRRYQAIQNKSRALKYGGTYGPCLPAPALPADSDQPVWQSDPALADQLGPYEDIGPYQIRIPKEYKRFHAPGPVTKTAFHWANRGSTQSGSILVHFPPAPPENSESSVTLPELLSDRLDRTVKPYHSAWEQSPPQWGKIGGLTFLKSSWKGKDAHAVETLGRAHGFECVCNDGENHISLVFIGDEALDLRLPAASVMSFRKK